MTDDQFRTLLKEINPSPHERRDRDRCGINYRGYAGRVVVEPAIAAVPLRQIQPARFKLGHNENPFTRSMKQHRAAPDHDDAEPNQR